MQPVLHVIGHLEKFCGPIIRGWSCDPDGNEMPFQIVQLQGSPIAGATTYATLGLGKIPLRSQSSDRIIRHELVMLSRSDAVPENLPALLQEVAMEAVQRNYAYLRGEVIGPRGPLFKGSTVTALYVAVPVYFPEEFSMVEDDVGQAISLGWLQFQTTRYP
jgi:hypothetical protein